MEPFGELFRRATGYVPHSYQPQLARDGLPIVAQTSGGIRSSEIALARLSHHMYGPDPEATPRRPIYPLPQRGLVEQVAGLAGQSLEKPELADQVEAAHLPGRLRTCPNGAHRTIDEVQPSPESATILRQFAAFTWHFGTAEPFDLICMSAAAPQRVLDDAAPRSDEVLAIIWRSGQGNSWSGGTRPGARAAAQRRHGRPACGRGPAQARGVYAGHPEHRDVGTGSTQGAARAVTPRALRQSRFAAGTRGSHSEDMRR